MREVIMNVGSEEVQFYGNEVDTSFDVAIQEFSTEYDYSYVPINANVIDIGAGYGEFSLEILTRMNPSHIYLFEPNITLLDYLNLNLKSYKKSITIRNAAVLDYNGETNLYFESHRSAAGSISEVQYAPDTLRAQQRMISKVELISIADVLEDLNHLDLVIKCDAEGAEYRIIQEFIRKFRGKQKVVLYIEYHRGKQNLIEILENAGFENKVQEKDEYMGLLTSIRSERSA